MIDVRVLQKLLAVVEVQRANLARHLHMILLVMRRKFILASPRFDSSRTDLPFTSEKLLLPRIMLGLMVTAPVTFAVERLGRPATFTNSAKDAFMVNVL